MLLKRLQTPPCGEQVSEGFAGVAPATILGTTCTVWPLFSALLMHFLAWLHAFSTVANARNYRNLVAGWEHLQTIYGL